MTDSRPHIIRKQKEISNLLKEQANLLKKLDGIFKELQTSLNLSNKEKEWINDLSITSIQDLYDVVYNRKNDYFLHILNSRSSFKDDKNKILSRLAELDKEIKNKSIDLLLDKIKKLENKIN